MLIGPFAALIPQHPFAIISFIQNTSVPWLHKLPLYLIDPAFSSEFYHAQEKIVN
jgi:hypothetical protein